MFGKIISSLHNSLHNNVYIKTERGTRGFKFPGSEVRMRRSSMSTDRYESSLANV